MADQTMKFELYDTIVGEKDWKSFRKTATQEELIAIALGSKYKSIGLKALTKKLISVVGTILSVLIGLFGFGMFGVFSIAVLIGGYVFFNLLAIKQIGYQHTYDSCCRKLERENKAYVEKYFHENAFVAILNALVSLALVFFVIPYQAIIILLTALFPNLENWGIAKGISSVVVSLPKGYDIGNLGAIGEYYRSHTFSEGFEQALEEHERERLEKYKKYTFETDRGEVELYSDNGKDFYDSIGSTIVSATSDDGGQTITFK